MKMTFKLILALAIGMIAGVVMVFVVNKPGVALTYAGWYLFGYLGLFINFTIRWIQEIKSGNARYAFDNWKTELRENEMVITATAGSYTVIYAICQWIGIKGWASATTVPLIQIIVNEGILKPSPFFAIIAPISMSLFMYIINKAKEKASEKFGSKITDDIPEKDSTPITPKP